MFAVQLIHGSALTERQPVLEVPLRNVFSSAARDVFFCPPPPYGWKMYSEKFDSDPVTLRPPPPASLLTPLADLIRAKLPDEARDGCRPMLPARRADNNKHSQSQATL